MVSRLSAKMQAILKNPSAARQIHEVAMTDSRAVVQDDQGHTYMVFTRNGAKNLQVRGKKVAHEPPK